MTFRTGSCAPPYPEVRTLHMTFRTGSCAPPYPEVRTLHILLGQGAVPLHILKLGHCPL